MRASAFFMARAAAAVAAAIAPSVAATTAARSAAGKQAVEELEVYLRTMNTAQRRWAREIVAHESHVRRLMMVEEQCRERLKQQVLKGTRAHLKYLTNTDLMAVAQLVTPPSVDVFLAYGIPPEQVSGFTVYVMGRLAADPNRLDVPLPILLADLSSTWAIVPPRKKEAYTELAAIFRPHLPAREAEPSDRAETKPSRRARQDRLKRQPPQQRQRPQASGSSAAGKRTAPRAAVSAARQRLSAKRVRTSQLVRSPSDTTPRPKSPPAPTSRRATRAPSTAAATPHRPTPPDTTTTTTTTAIPTGAARGEARASAHPRRSRSAAAPLHPADRELVAATATQLGLAGPERAAFSRFAQASLREMTSTLSGDARLVPAIGGSHTGSGSSSGGRRAGARKNSTAREAQLRMQAWLPLAAQEWTRKTRRQKAFYLRAAADKATTSHG